MRIFPFIIYGKLKIDDILFREKVKLFRDEVDYVSLIIITISHNFHAGTFFKQLNIYFVNW